MTFEKGNKNQKVEMHASLVSSVSRSYECCQTSDTMRRHFHLLIYIVWRVCQRQDWETTRGRDRVHQWPFVL